MITFADISEFQHDASLPTYRAQHDVLIIRAHNGSRPDHEWPAWRDLARSLNFTALGFYQYMVAERSASSQAHDFINTVGRLRSNEFVICDSEEGANSQISRVEIWLTIVDRWYGRKSSLYASESWFDERLGGAARWRRPRWMAAYRAAEPTAPHEWWQNTEKAAMAGIPKPHDGNLFHGTSQDFAFTVLGKSQQPSNSADVWGTTMSVSVMKNGQFELFAERATGEIMHKWQKDGVWSSWSSLGTPGK